MTLHDLIAEFEAEFAALVARFRSHPAVQPAPAPVVHQVPAPAPTPAAAPSGFDWSKYAGQTDSVAFMAFVMAGRGNPQDADKAAAYAAGVVKTQVPTPSGMAPDRWATTFPWTNAGGDPLYFNKATRFTVPLPPGYSGKVRVDFGETPAAGPVPEKLKLNEQLFEGPNVRTAFAEIDASAPFEFNAEPLDANGNPVVGQGGSLVLHHSP